MSHARRTRLGLGSDADAHSPTVALTSDVHELPASDVEDAETPRITEYSFRPGAVLSGRFVVDKLVGAGGQCFVYEAHHVTLRQRVAVKTLRPELLDHGDVIERFAREAEAMTAIRNAHVANVLDAGRAPCGAPFIVMEFLAGRDLASFLEARPRLPPRQAFEIFLQICEGVAAAHAVGLVHQDIKPANIFLAEEMGLLRAKVVDFGVARISSRQTYKTRIRGIRAEDALAGTPLYMSPEQLARGQVDARSDIFSLGLVLYEMLRGTLEFDREMRVRSLGSPVPVDRTALDRDAAPGVADVVARCLEMDPADRYADLGELAVAVLPFAPTRSRANAESTLALLDGHAARPRRVELPSMFPPSSSSAPDASPEASASPQPVSSPPTSSKRPTATLSLGVALLAVGALAALAWPSPRRAAPPSVVPQVAQATPTPISTPQATSAQLTPSAPAPHIEIVEAPSALRPPVPPRPAPSARPAAAVVPRTAASSGVDPEDLGF